jgi:hypothetical protein
MAQRSPRPRKLHGGRWEARVQSAQDGHCAAPRLAYAFNAMRNWRAGKQPRRHLWPIVVALSPLSAMVAACLPGSGPPLNPHEDDAGAPSSIDLSGEGGLLADVDLGDPFAVTGLLPSHGPWTGGTRATITGRGFPSGVKVWIGSTALDPSEVFASDPTRASVVTPAGTPGAADVRVRNDATAQERTLVGGFFYDALVVSPSSGATTGGTRIVLRGSGTHWTSGSVVAVGGQPCTSLSFTDSTDLACTTPAGSPGSQDVTVTTAGGALDQARDAFTYSDSPDGYRGGLYGGALSGNLQVIAFDAWTGTPLAGGKAIAGSNLATAVVGTFDASGTVALSGPSLTGKVTVTVAAKCHQPVTFVDVPVDTVTAYLVPELDPSSCQGDPPSSGNGVLTQYGEVDGELAWTGGIEFERAAWKNVPSPIGSEQQVAYVWTTTGDPVSGFQLPSAASATTPASDGLIGYAYALGALPGNQNVYALAGLEDRSATPPWFEPYVMGVVRGVLVQPGTKTIGVDIPMTTLLDHVVTTSPQPPVPTPRGPDRLLSTLAVNVGAGQFAILPQGTASTLLPISGTIPFVGVPSLDGTLSGASYDLTGAAVSGANGSSPTSVVRRIETTNANDLLTVGGFFAIPTLIQPSAAQWSGTHVTLQASGPIDIAVVNVSSGNGLLTWQIVAPGSNLSFDVPDLSQVPGVAGLVHGPLSTTFSIARMEGFDYTQLRYGQLNALRPGAASNAWNAYAQDTTAGSY